MSEILPVAYIHTDFPTKFGIPRQSGLVNTLAKIVFEEKYRIKEALRGIEGYSHLWLIWEFSENKGNNSGLTVRPPRLGGNVRMGVFATRSPFRPNSLGLSCVKIEKIDYEDKNGPVIYVTGADMLDKTPIFDIKPYLPYTDSHPDAKSGFSAEVFFQNLSVIFPEKVLDNVEKKDIPLIEKILSEDPRPHYQNDPNRVYSFEFSKYRIKFTVNEDTLTVKEIQRII